MSEMLKTSELELRKAENLAGRLREYAKFSENTPELLSRIFEIDVEAIKAVLGVPAELAPPARLTGRA